MHCNICGSIEFEAGFKGRLTNGIAPMCSGCKGVERHRIVRSMYEPLEPLISQWRALHFAPDHSVDKNWFKEYIGSSYGGPNSLDMMDTKLPDGSFDLVLSNHVLEHVQDDFLALNESLRLVGDTGIVHVCVPTPTHRWTTEDWGFADPNINEHYRDYGADFPQTVLHKYPRIQIACVVGFDKITGVGDIVYFFSKNSDSLAALGQLWTRAAIPIVRLHSNK